MKRRWIYFWAIILIVSCNDPYKNSTYQVYDVNPISTYLDSRPEDFSEWVAILRRADLYNALNQAEETFTAFVPNNEAVKEYLQKKEIPSIAEMDVSYARDLVFYHVINGAVPTVEAGKLALPTVSEDFLTIDYGAEGGINSIYINNEARILEFAEDSLVSNGYIYVLETVLTPLLETLYERLLEHEEYSIFREAIEETGWQNRLNVVYDTTVNLDGTKNIVKRTFTLLGVTNDVYAQSGISSLQDLKNTLNANSDYTSEDNSLYKYVAYHLIQQTYYPEDLFKFQGGDTVKIWSTQAKNEVISTSVINGDFFINYNYGKETGIQLVTDNVDELIIARNGVILDVNDYMPLFEPVAVSMKWDLCNYEEVEYFVNNYAIENGYGSQLFQTPYSSSELYIKLNDNPSALTCYKWQAYNSASADKNTKNWFPVGYMVLKTASGTNPDFANNYKAYKHNYLILNLGYLGNISMETPVILKGKYKVDLYYGYASSLNTFRSGGSQTQITLNNHTKIANIFDGIGSSTGTYSVTLWDEMEFETTSSHEFKIVLMDSRASTNDSYRLQLDYVEFTLLD